MKKNGKKGGRKKAEQLPIDPLTLAPLQTVLDHLGVSKNDWDVVLVGDGSGSTWQAGCGWAAVLIDRESKQRRVFFGAMSCGTVNLSELLPYLQAIMWYDNAKNEWLKTTPKTPVKIHVITDSKYTADAGNKLIPRKANKEIWAALDVVVQKGYHITWHWMGRSETGLNMLADHLSKLCRTTLGKVSVPDGTNVYAFNPHAVCE